VPVDWRCPGADAYHLREDAIEKMTNLKPLMEKKDVIKRRNTLQKKSIIWA
jgi:hypothetical protein